MWPKRTSMPMSCCAKQGRRFEGKVTSDAVWFKASSGHDGNELQNLVVNVLENFIPTQGFDIHRDVQVPPPLLPSSLLSHATAGILHHKWPVLPESSTTKVPRLL